MSCRSGDAKRRTNPGLMQHLILSGRGGVGSARRGAEREGRSMGIDVTWKRM